MDEPVKVLVIPPVLERNTENLLKQLTASFKNEYTFYTIKPIPRDVDGRVDYEELTHKCRVMIQVNAISVLYANKHTASLVLAALCEEFPNLIGPKAESVFLCNHKYYTSLLIDSRKKKFPYQVQDVREDIYDTAAKLLEEMPRPCLIRSCLGSGHSVYFYKNRDQLIKVLERCRKDVPHILEIQKWVLETFIDLRKYPYGNKPVILMHPYLDRYSATAGRTWVNVGIEACVYNGEIIPWAILDVVTLPYGSKEAYLSFPGCQMPTRLSQASQDKLWVEFKADIKNVMKYGFNNSFIHAEYVIFENGYTHLVTMNARPDAESTNIYIRALHNGNNVKAALEIGRGNRPIQPKPNGNFVLDYCMVVPQSGKADNLIRFDKAHANPDVTLRYLPGQDINIEPAKDFSVVGYITVTGKGFTECLEKVKKIRGEILKIPELVPLTC